MHELVKIFSFSNSSFHSFSLSFTRRFGNTRSWKGSLKCLILIHRLLRSYAQLLDQALDCFSLDNKETEEEVMHESLQHKIKQVSRKLELLPRLQSLIDRVLDCIPTGVAPRSLIVQQAMKHIIRDRFICYTTFRREIVLVLDNLLEMPYRSCVSAFGIYKKAAMQAGQLCESYDWCKAKGFCALETFFSGMWQLTNQSSSSLTTSPSSWVEFKSNSTEDDDQEKQVIETNTLIKISSQLERSEENGCASNFELGKEEVAPLIQLEEGEDDNWEALLEASLNTSSHDHRKNFLVYPNSFSNGYGDGHGYENQLICLDDQTKREEQDQWQLQVYNPNPFCQLHSYFPSFNGSACNPAFPWGF
ncbi:clathrin assembly protein [Populus alba x Populus x berolinensis]|nr:clathrin assembly protein [Populus alba x Populus x berolinensis]